MLDVAAPAERLSAPDSLEAQLDVLYQQGWTDGLPVVPPTPERVEAMMAGTPHAAQELIGLIPPRWGTATVEVVSS